MRSPDPLPNREAGGDDTGDDGEKEHDDDQRQRRGQPQGYETGDHRKPPVSVRRRPGEKSGAIRYIYFTILITHTILAATVPVLAIITLRRGLAARYDKHRRIARWTLPIWLYVSITGVVVYVMLYHL